METILFIIALVLAMLLLWLRRGSSEKARRIPLTISPQKSRRDKLYGVLPNQVLGDRKKAQRLIEAERRKDPMLTEEQCIEMASSTIERDIRRWD